MADEAEKADMTETNEKKGKVRHKEAKEEESVSAGDAKLLTMHSNNRERTWNRRHRIEQR